jgi:uncharacterized protein (TIRG00374 family)
MSSRNKKLITTAVRWTFALVGILWVLTRLSFRDTVWVLGPKDLPMAVPLSTRHNESSDTYSILNANTGQEDIISARDTVLRPDRDRVTLKDGKSAKLRAIRTDSDKPTIVTELLIEDPASGRGTWIKPRDVQGGYTQEVIYPRIERGLIRMVQEADLKYLLFSIAIFPITFIITAFRWYELLKALDIFMGLRRTFIINMVGAFYNTFMPGSTGGDVLRAYYAAQQTTHKIRAVMSVAVDRAIGLLALIILGGTMAALQYHIPECRKVARGAGIAVAMTALGLLVFYLPLFRRIFLIDFILKKLPMQKRIQHAVETMEIYGRRPGLAAAALVASFPVHATVVVSAAFAGKAFGLPIAWGYYWVVVPVIVLAGSIPISPQGAGVMEFFAVKLTQTRGVSVGQAVALTMSVRLVQILWNLVGGLFVLKGGFHAPSEKEQHDLEEEAPVDQTKHPVIT